MVRGGGRSALLALCLAVAGLAVASAQGLGCDIATFVKGVANISNLQISSQLLATSSPNAPNNTAVFLPTDAAWQAFRAANGANAPDANRSIAILLYNSVISYGQASEATLVANSPIQTSAADLVSSYLTFVKGQKADPALPLSFAKVNGVTVATDVGKHTASFNGSYSFCNQRVYATNGVLLPAATYAQVPETYLSDIAALNALNNAPVASPPPPARVPPPTAVPASALTPSPSTAPTTSAPSTSANTPAPAAVPSPAASPAPAPAPSASRPAATFAATAGGSILAAAAMLFALI